MNTTEVEAPDSLTATGRKIKMGWVVYSPTPYKTPLFKALAQRADLETTFLFLCWDDPQRGWKQNGPAGFRFEVLSGVSLRASLKRASYIQFAPSVVRALRKNRFDLVVIGGYGHPTLLLALLYCLVTSTKFVIQGETHVVHKRHAFKRAIKRCFLYPLLRRAKAAFATGRMAVEYWVEVGIPREKILLLSNTPDLDYFLDASVDARKQRAQIRQSLDLRERRTGIFVGRFVDVKGVEIVLDAVSKLPPDKQPQLLLVGDGPLKARYEAIMRVHNLSVRFTGFRQKEELPKLYAAADFFFLPSLDEPWGVVVNEAMACGLPVLLSHEVGAAYDLLEEGRNGYMITAGNVDAWVKSISRVMELSDVDLYQMGVASREIVRPWNHANNVKSVIECVRLIYGPQFDAVEKACT